VVGPDFPDAIVTLSNLAGARVKCGEVEQASVDYKTAVERANRRFGAAHPLTLQITIATARFEMRRGNVERSEEVTRVAIETANAAATDALPAENPFVAALRSSHG